MHLVYLHWQSFPSIVDCAAEHLVPDQFHVGWILTLDEPAQVMFDDVTCRLTTNGYTCMLLKDTLCSIAARNHDNGHNNNLLLSLLSPGFGPSYKQLARYTVYKIGANIRLDISTPFHSIIIVIVAKGDSVSSLTTTYQSPHPDVTAAVA